jgi:hypothetical protein
MEIGDDGEHQGIAESDPLANRDAYAKQHQQGQVYKTHYPKGENPFHKAGMKDKRSTKMSAYDISNTGPKGQLPESDVAEGTFQDDGKMDWNAWKQKAKKHGAVKFTDTDNKTIAYDKDGKVVSSITWSQKKSGVAEAAQGHTIEAHGVRGIDRKTWHKTFKNVDQMNAWAEKYDAEVHGTRDLEQAQRGNLSPAMEGVTETTSSAGMATAPGVGKGPKTGTLFGGSYAPRTPFAGKKKANTSVIKR